MLSLVEFGAHPIQIVRSQCVINNQMIRMTLLGLLGHEPEAKAVERVCAKLAELGQKAGFLIFPCSGALCDATATLLLLYLEEVKEAVNEAEFLSGTVTVCMGAIESLCQANIQAKCGQQEICRSHSDPDIFVAINSAVRQCLQETSLDASFLRQRILRQEVVSPTEKKYCRVYVTMQYQDQWWVTGWYAKDEVSAFTKALMDGYRYFAWASQAKSNSLGR